MVYPTIFLENQFGEKSENAIIGGTNTVGTAPIANNTILGNKSGSSALPAAIAIQEVSDALPAKTGVTAISALATPISPITATLSTSNTYTDAAVKAAIDGALVTVVSDMQLQLTKINAILAALKVTA